jgi:hypothetical protein
MAIGSSAQKACDARNHKQAHDPSADLLSPSPKMLETLVEANLKLFVNPICTLHTA